MNKGNSLTTREFQASNSGPLFFTLLIALPSGRSCSTLVAIYLFTLGNNLKRAVRQRPL